MPHATVCTQITITAQNARGSFATTFVLSVLSAVVFSSPHSVLVAFHCCIATVARGTSQRVFEDHPLSSVLAFRIMMKFIKFVKLVFSGNTKIAYEKKSARNTMVFHPQKY